MSRRPTLTIGIPTFNRSDSVAARISEFVGLDLGRDVTLLVIDNASTDGTFQRLDAEFEVPGMRLLSNPENLGYGGNFLRLCQEADSDYLMILSDEDQLVRDGVEALLRFCREASPGFVSPVAHVRGNPMYRGRPDSRRVEPSEFKQASFYVSGLTFAVHRLREDARELGDLLTVNSAVAIYPQVLLAALATAREDAHFLGALVTKQVEHRATNITERAGGIYNRFIGRWLQTLGFEEYFAERIATSEDAVRDRFITMRNRAREDVLEMLLVAMRRDAPEVASVVEESMRRRVLGDGPVGRIRKVLGAAKARFRARE